MESEHKTTRLLYYFLQLTWGIPQNLCGFLLRCYLLAMDPERERSRFFASPVTNWNLKASMGLGMFIFFGHKGTANEQGVLVHEFGHTVQSAVLGPLFLPVIGIPSLVWASVPVFQKWRDAGKFRYVDFYPEKWANSWGEKVTHFKAIVK